MLIEMLGSNAKNKNDFTKKNQKKILITRVNLFHKKMIH